MIIFINIIGKFGGDKVEKVVLLTEETKNIQEIKYIFQKENIKVYFTKNTNDVLKVLEEDKDIDLIIIDMSSNSVKGLECISLIKGKYRYKHIPIVIISPKEEVMKGLAIGAQEYIIPPYTTKDFCEFIKDILNNYKYNEEVYIPQTSVDMTFEQYFNSEIKRAERGNYELSILILTITSKSSNKLVSEKNRIEIINQLALLVKDNLRATDTIIRYNKGNIITFLPYTPRFNAEIVYEKILKVFEEKFTYLNNDLERWEVIYSIVSYPKDGEDVRDLLFNAEQCLEKNKNGR